MLKSLLVLKGFFSLKYFKWPLEKKNSVPQYCQSSLRLLNTAGKQGGCRKIY